MNDELAYVIREKGLGPWIVTVQIDADTFGVCEGPQPGTLHACQAEGGSVAVCAFAEHCAMNSKSHGGWWIAGNLDKDAMVGPVPKATALVTGLGAYAALIPSSPGQLSRITRIPHL